MGATRQATAATVAARLRESFMLIEFKRDRGRLWLMQNRQNLKILAASYTIEIAHVSFLFPGW